MAETHTNPSVRTVVSIMAKKKTAKKNTTKKKVAPKKPFRKLIKWCWLLFIGGFVTFGLLLLLVSWGVFGELPSFEELENPKYNEASQIMTGDGKLLSTFYIENRTMATYDDLSIHLVDALVATEDERFYEHSGVDGRGLLRAVVFLGKRGGASTITQQLAKMLFHDRSQNFFKAVIQKLKEWIIAARLEKQYTKQEIIAMYFNKYDFVNNAVGIDRAAAVYFNTTPKLLKIEEAAMLVGMAKNASLFNPLRRPEETLQRRNVVMYQMVKNGYLSQERYDSLKVLPLGIDYQSASHKEGTAPYFREALRKELSVILGENSGLTKPNGQPYNIYRDGLKIYTTIDSRMQKHAEWAVVQHLKSLQKDFFKDIKRKKNYPFDFSSKADADRAMKQAMKQTQRYRLLTGKECTDCGRGALSMETVQHDGHDYYRCTVCSYERYAMNPDSIPLVFETPVKMRVFSWEGTVEKTMTPMDSIRYYKSFLQVGFMSMDPNTGFIKAWVGGINDKAFSYDHVRQAKRQVGSTFKPIMYALAVQEGMQPCEEIPNLPYTIKKGEWGMSTDWTPGYGPKFDGVLTYKFGLANSMNNIAAYVMKKYGPEPVIGLAHQMGIYSELEPVPSICLGVADVSLFEMTGAYCTFANKGVWTQPTFITRIEDRNGNIIKEYQRTTREVLSEEDAYIMLNMMKGVADGVYNEDYGKRSSTGYYRLRTKYKLTPPIAGKTGTTQSNSDGWFIGITPELVSGVWVGAEDRRVRFSTTRDGQGANMALPIWAMYMKKVYADPKIKISKSDFEPPSRHVGVELDCESIVREPEFN